MLDMLRPVHDTLHNVIDPFWDWLSDDSNLIYPFMDGMPFHERL